MKRPTLRIREWQKITPASPGGGPLLQGAYLTDSDRELLAELEQRSSLKVTELRSGLAVSVGPHIGTISLSQLRIVIMPKLRIDSLMRMIAFAFELSDIWVTEPWSEYSSGEEGMIDLLGVSLLRSVERLARGGLLPDYQTRCDDLTRPRGRLDMHHIASHPRRTTLRCTYDEHTVDHSINQIVAAGLRLASKVMQTVDLRLDLARAADRFFGDLSRISLEADLLRGHVERLDRRSSHYRTALTLITLIYQGAYLRDHEEAGKMPLVSFTLNMNRVFEKFLERYFRKTAPETVRVSGQDTRTDVFTYLENGGGWKQPTIRPDIVIRSRTGVIAVADAKYKNRHEHPPASSELQQLSIYGLAYQMPEPREVLILHPLSSGEIDRVTTVLFAPPAAKQQVRIRMVGVPIGALLDGTTGNWWPFP